MSTVNLEGAQVAGLWYDTAGQVPGVVYGPAGCAGRLGGVVHPEPGWCGDRPNVDNRVRTLGETLTRSQAGRVTQRVATDRVGRAGTVDWSCGNDAGGRLTTAALAPAGADLRCRWGSGIPQWVGVARTPIDVDAL